MTKLFQHGNIDNQIADRHAYARLSILWLENAEGKILQWKMRIFCDLDERAKSHAYDLTTKITEEHEELFQIFFFKQLRNLLVLRGNKSSRSARKSPRGSSKLQLPKDDTNFRR